MSGCTVCVVGALPDLMELPSPTGAGLGGGGVEATTAFAGVGIGAIIFSAGIVTTGLTSGGGDFGGSGRMTGATTTGAGAATSVTAKSFRLGNRAGWLKVT